MKLLGSCCGCYSLQFGTVFVGVCGILLSIINLIMLVTLDVKWKTIIFDIDQDLVKIIFAINLVMTIIISTLLIIGALRRKLFLMLPWVVLGIMLAISLLVSVIYTSIMFFIEKDVINGVFWIVFGLIAVVIYTYMWFVVYSYYEEVKLEKMTMKIGPYGRPYTYGRP